MEEPSNDQICQKFGEETISGIKFYTCPSPIFPLSQLSGHSIVSAGGIFRPDGTDHPNPRVKPWVLSPPLFRVLKGRLMHGNAEMV
jgi:hypothetical protein